MRQFDLIEFHRYLNEERLKRKLSWRQLAEEANRPFISTTSIPINTATFRDMPQKRSVTSAVILQLLRWLGRSPEAFLVPQDGDAFGQEAALPVAAPDHILRLDTQELHTALDAERKRRGMTWSEVAAELPGFQPGMLTSLATGPLIGFPRVMLLTQWLKMPLARFVKARTR
jgi:hypothetical protein